MAARKPGPLEPPGFGASVALGAAFGLLAGLGELAFLAARKYGRGLFLFRPLDTIWMTPVAASLTLALATALVVGAARLAGRPLSQRVVVGIGVGLTALSLLLLLPPIHPAASALLAAGLGVQASRMRWSSAPGLRRAAGRLVGIGLPLCAVVAVLVGWAPRIRERRALAALPAPAVAGPNVLLIILDTVRAMSLSLYGYERPTTPELERWARRGVRFTQAQSTAPWTLPSHGSIFTARQAFELSTDWYAPLDHHYPTLAEYLDRSGYLTAGFVANLPYTNREVGLAQGFQHYDDFPRSLGQLAISASLPRALLSNPWIRRVIGSQELVVRKHGAEVSRELLTWLDHRPPGRPFFAFLNYYDAHTPFVPPEPFRSRFAPAGAPFHSDLDRKTDPSPWDTTQIQGARNAYDGAIAALDHEIGRLFDELDRRGLWDSTLVILASDHGEEFAEHNLFSHGNSLYYPSLHVPLLIWLAGRVPADTAIDTPVSLRDLPSTVVALTGLDRGAPFPGRPLTRFWAVPGDSSPDTLFTEVRHAPKLPAWYPSTKGDVFGVQTGLLRLIRNADGAIEAYDLETDPLERRNLALDPAFQDRIQSLHSLADRVHPPRGEPNP